MTDLYDRWIHSERRDNLGSPNRRTFSSSSSLPTSPKFGTRHINIPLLQVPGVYQRFTEEADSLLVLLGEPPGVPLHPDLACFLKPEHFDTFFMPRRFLRCEPTASPRTMFLQSEMDTPVFLKLSYPFRLGRFGASLTLSKADFSVSLSEYISQNVGKLGPDCGWFPEIGYFGSHIFENSARNGDAICIVRSAEPEYSDRASRLPISILPYFSFHEFCGGNSLKYQMELCKLPIQEDVVIEKFLRPLFESAVRFVSQLGLVPEPHSQNLLSIVTERRDGTREVSVAWRDSLGFKPCRQALADADRNWGHDLDLREIDCKEEVVKEVSVALDHMLWHYTVLPFLHHSSALGLDFAKMVALARDQFIAVCEQEGLILPKDGWYFRSSDWFPEGCINRVEFTCGTPPLRGN